MFIIHFLLEITKFGAIIDTPHIKSYLELLLLNRYIPTFQGAVPTCAVLPLGAQHVVYRNLK
jgi:hypothetical protein